MEHITVKPYGTKYSRLTPDDGYMLTDGRTEYSSALVKKGTESKWRAVPIE